ncbi:hypothetical protein HETIRDRAFT_319093 [Heterobasidion irregulare TC 32-1]|uniref:PLP-dependent transferase n=1 Tax=Heterobasidion irregulare (strain TC 32-1) TaxID=747525 RepID=W4K837_HETIT|nr:uncharacterized protein HETIRDRAFT_319093 [Heterobasidion irregulare TC 32-1]ETW81515.1 hypothetical protein HETIRDRAFT_319093 [Heterobasidion irregulare TC 32-1]
MLRWLPRLSDLVGTLSTSRSTVSETSPPGSLRDAHHAAGAWFLGPKAENAEYLQKFVGIILQDLTKCRKDFSPEDKDFIDPAMVSSQAFKDSMSKLETNVTFLSSLLPQHSIPFYSPRYMAHMLNDVSMPATLGYLMALMYNPNNVAVEGSPLTSIIEYDVGQQLCSMLGFNVAAPNQDPRLSATGWGHITCDGSVANMESMCKTRLYETSLTLLLARNLKYYPLSLKRAVESEPSLAFISHHFNIHLCSGKEKSLAECDAWDLLNLTPEEVVSLPGRIASQFCLSVQSLQGLMGKYIIQTTGKDDLDAYFGLQRPPQYLASKTIHYSWPKGAAMTGIGSKNLIGVPVDQSARMDCEALDALLAQYLHNRQAVYCVVAIMGTTEHGTVDPISKIVALRSKYQKRGLSFLIHADAAWGGYFTSVLVPNPTSHGGESSLDDPALFLHPYTKNELHHIRYADSVTIDPHKSGYVPYPAGSLCYRDGRLRYLVTWTSPVIDSPEDGAQKMGVYGIEGSKPGAAPVAAWLGHEVIGLHKDGYGFLLGEAVYTGIKMYGHWATMSLDHPTLLMVPFRMLPSEMKPNCTAKDIDDERRYIRDVILARTRQELAADPHARALMQQLGSDLVVNAFACNFRVNGKINKDVSEANLLNARIYERLSFHKLTDKLNDRKVILMSTVFSQKEYGSCLTNYKKRLGLAGDGDLFALVNVSMSPFASPLNFEKVLADAFRETAEEEVKISIERNKSAPSLHAFIVQGSTNVYLVHMPCFSSASQRRQCILTGELSETGRQKYLHARTADPSATFIASTLQADELSHISIIKNRPLNSRYLDQSYPTSMPFYLYGNSEEIHLDHMLLHAPNAQISANNVAVELDGMELGILASDLRNGLIAIADTLPEHLLQPFTAEHRPNFFRPGFKVGITIYHDRSTSSAPGPGLVESLSSPLARGAITLGDSIFIESNLINVGTPLVASHVPKRNSFLPSSAESTTQDHPYFRGFGLERHMDAVLSRPNKNAWRQGWDIALAQRQFAKMDIESPIEYTIEEKLTKEYCQSPVTVRASFSLS